MSMKASDATETELLSFQNGADLKKTVRAAMRHAPKRKAARIYQISSAEFQQRTDGVNGLSDCNMAEVQPAATN